MLAGLLRVTNAGLAAVAFNAMAVHAADATDATDAGASDRALEEIVVSARKRDEPLERTPVAVTVVTDADLQP